MEQWSEAAQNQVSDLKIHFYAPETRIAAQALAKTWKCDMSAKRQSSCERKQGWKHFPFRRDWKITPMTEHYSYLSPPQLWLWQFRTMLPAWGHFQLQHLHSAAIVEDGNQGLNWRDKGKKCNEGHCGLPAPAVHDFLVRNGMHGAIGAGAGS